MLFGGGPSRSAHAGSVTTSSTAPTTDLGCDSHHGCPGARLDLSVAGNFGSSTRPYWILEKFSVSPLLDAGLSESMLAAYFDNPQTFLIVKSANPAKDPLLPNATYVMSFADYQQMVDAISSGSIPSYIKWILYDDEKWPSTPVAQQQQPFTYEAEAETVAHEHGLGLIFTPAANLTTVLSTAYSNATKYDGYTGLGIASQAAPHADVLEIQAQQDESAPPGSTASFPPS